MSRLPIACFSLLFSGILMAGDLHAADLSPLKVSAVTGSHAGNAVDYVADRKDQTTVYLFVNGTTWDRPIARYLKVLDTKIAEGVKKADDAQVIAVWLSDDAAKGKEYLPKAQQSLKLTRTDWTVFEGEKAGPEGWNVDVADHLTAVVVRDGKEVDRFKYKSTNDTDVPDVIKALEKE